MSLCRISSGSEDGWFYVWRTEPNNTNHSDSSTTSNTAVTRKQQRQFGRAFERIRGKVNPSECMLNPHG